MTEGAWDIWDEIEGNLDLERVKEEYRKETPLEEIYKDFISKLRSNKTYYIDEDRGI